MNRPPGAQNAARMDGEHKIMILFDRFVTDLPIRC